jgi:hypothetical protein
VEDILKALIFAAVLVASPALADPIDDYVSCMIGQSAVALHAQPAPKDSARAQEAAHKLCPEPASYGDDEPDGVGDFINLAVEAIAKGVWPE